eukprot:scaffold2882_cov434-Prasinococcus_capsulatus_cf.AAC.9
MALQSGGYAALKMCATYTPSGDFQLDASSVTRVGGSPAQIQVVGEVVIKVGHLFVIITVLNPKVVCNQQSWAVVSQH